MEGYNQPFSWWGWHWSPPEPLSVIQLIESGSFSARLMALLWMMIERRASLIIAAEPPEAGKTTTLTALVDFLPASTEKVFTRGLYETFEFVGGSDPQRTYLLCNEISDHIPVYMWGDNVARMFDLLEQGYALASTMHANSVEEVTAILESEPMEVTPTQLAHLTLVIALRLGTDKSGKHFRRVNAIHFLHQGSRKDLQIDEVTHWDPAQDVFTPTPPAVVAALAQWAGLPTEAFEGEWKKRTEFFAALSKQEIRSLVRVREAMALYKGESAAQIGAADIDFEEEYR